MKENKLKITTIIGTRPEIIRLSLIIKKLDHYFHHQLIHTGQNYDYELNDIFFKDLSLRKPDYFLDAAGKSSIETIANTITKVDEVLEKIKPDGVLVLGDTNSAFGLLAAKRRKIPTFHMEAGNRCFDQRVPEEMNRKIIDHIADINLTYGDIAREHLLREGLAPDMVIKTGSPMFEVLNANKKKIQASKILSKLNLKAENYFLISAHREENIESKTNFRKLVNVINSLAEHYKLPIIISTHPRTFNRILTTKATFSTLVQLLKPLSFSDYVKLQIHAKVTLSDSGTITEESSILNFPALNIREAYERPEGMEEAAVMLTGLELDKILQAIEILKNQPRGNKRLLKLVHDYNIANVSDKILRIILSHITYVNQKVWKKFETSN